MFNSSYFPNRYFAPRYWANIGSSAPAVYGGHSDRTEISFARSHATQITITGPQRTEISFAQSVKSELHPR